MLSATLIVLWVQSAMIETSGIVFAVALEGLKLVMDDGMIIFLLISGQLIYGRGLQITAVYGRC